MNTEISINTFIEILDEISSVELQVKLWLNIENETGLVSSYVELINNFSSSDFIYVVENLIVKEELKNDLIKLKEMVNSYEEPKLYKTYKNDVYIVADPNWKKIRDYAKQIKQNHSVYLQKLKNK